MLIISVSSESSDSQLAFIPIIALTVIALLGYFFMKKLVFDLSDAIYDEGDSLLFRFGRKEVRVKLEEIINLNYQTIMSLAK